MSDHRKTTTYPSMSPISEFYANKSVFITGATGFMGKVLLEKLLRQYRRIKNIYVLVRNKKGSTARERFNSQILGSSIFEEVKLKLRNDSSDTNHNVDIFSDDPDMATFINKIKCISGDMCLPRLGIGDDDWKMLMHDDSLTVVFHLAATVRFNEPLKTALQFNVLAVKNIIDFSRCLNNLVCLSYMSTAFVSCDMSTTDEIIEERPYLSINEDPIKMLQLIDCIQEDSVMKKLESTLLGSKPNTYAYTKSLAEKLLVEYGSNLPIVIMRPTIVVGSWLEPVKGWVDRHSGLTNVLVASSLGMLRVFNVDMEKHSEFIPVDTCICTMIAAVWHFVRQHGNESNRDQIHNNNGILHSKIRRDDEKESQPTLKVYHCASSGTNKIMLAKIMDLIGRGSHNSPSKRLFRYPRILAIKNVFLCKVLRFVSHTLVANLCDRLYYFLGREHQLVIQYEKLDTAMDMISYFSTNQWTFQTDNMVNLYQCLDEEDKIQLSPMNISQLNWYSYWDDFTSNCIQNLLKEDSKDSLRAKQKLAEARKIDLALRCVSVMANLSFLLIIVNRSVSLPATILWIVIGTIMNLMIWL